MAWCRQTPVMRVDATLAACFARWGALLLTRSSAMSGRDDDSFRARPGPPKTRGRSFVSKVLWQVGRAGGKPAVRRAGPVAGKGRRKGQRPGPRLGRGHTAARFTGRALTPSSRRVAIKTLLVNLRRASPQSLAKHLRYIERDGVGRDGEPGRAYGSLTSEADLEAFKERSQGDRHQFRFIVSPEDGAELEDLRTYTRHLMSRMEADLGTQLDWVAVNHWNTDNPHTHVALRGKDDTGNDLIIAGDYIAHGLRERAAELATEWLGPRTELEIQQTLRREVDQERWTSLDRALQQETVEGLLRIERLTEARSRHQREPLIGRLQHLQRLGLADEQRPGIWSIHADAERTLRAMGERGDIIRTMQQAMSGQSRDLMVFEPGEHGNPIVGRIAAKGLADELQDRGYMVVDAIDGRAHYVALNAREELRQYPLGAVVEVRGSTGLRAADRTIAALTVDGLYRADHHLAIARGQAKPNREPREVVAAHVRRLEALRRAGIVERITEGLWKVPGDLPEQGRKYDAQRVGGVTIGLHSHLTIEQQARAMGATWLDKQLLGGALDIGDRGFGGEVREALQQRTDFLLEQDLAEQRGRRVIFARNLLSTLRRRDIDGTARALEAATGLVHRPVVEGERISGTYRRSIQLASGRFALLDDGMGFSLVPWKPVIAQRLGQVMTATVRGSGVSWEFGKQRGPTVG